MNLSNLKNKVYCKMDRSKLQICKPKKDVIHCQSKKMPNKIQNLFQNEIKQIKWKINLLQDRLEQFKNRQSLLQNGPKQITKMQNLS